MDIPLSISGQDAGHGLKLKTLRFRAPAKINWTLEVLRRREDGYHEVRTVLQTIDLYDELEFTDCDDLRLDTEGAPDLGEDDLVLRAASLVRPPGQGALIRLRKRIPSAAGLGGGSSDAAATLRGLNALWELDLSREPLAEKAAELGSDVPFFLYGGSALASGRGEAIEPLPDAPPYWLVLAVPPITKAAKTESMYSLLPASAYSNGARTDRFARELRERRNFPTEFIENVFEQTALHFFPDLARFKKRFREASGRPVHLAGSGPALFAPAGDRGEAEAIRDRCVTSGCQVILARTTTRAEALEIPGDHR